MSDTPPTAFGSIGWHDLTVEDAPGLRDFYSRVAGWTAQEHDMGGYADFVMLTGDGQGAGGICHARGASAGLPAAWLIYIVVPDLAAALEAVEGGGGEVLVPARDQGGQGSFAVVRDPAGAAFALYQPTAAAG